MYMYFSTFISGLSSIIELQLKDCIPDVSIKLVQDGIIIYSTNISPEDIVKLRFFNNTFSLVKTFKNTATDTKSINKIIKKTIEDKNVFYHLGKKIPKNNKSFRIVISVGNIMISPDKNMLYKLENKITDSISLRVDRAIPDIELWYFLRREVSDAYFGIRLTRHTEYSKILQKGELHPELVNTLCYLSDPQINDIYLDPFVGSGAIPIELSKSFVCKSIIAVDIDDSIVQRFKDRSQNLKIDVRSECMDSLNLANLKNNSMNKIVTDPPWGINIGKDLNLEIFYKQMLLEFFRILDVNGVIVILIGNKELFENVLNKLYSFFKIIDQYNILVSGKKAGIYKISVMK